MLKNIKYLVLFLLIMPFLFSCVNTKKVTYFNDLSDTILLTSTIIPETVIQKNDLLSITVSSLNPQATEIFNVPSNNPSATQPAGYLVNSDGFIQFPVLGSIKAEGLTKEALKASITKSLADRKLLVDPVVSVRFQNFRVTVLGEVVKPTVVPVPSEKITLLEALGFAGDITIYGKRDNVLVIREEEGVRNIKRLNLNSSELLTSLYYYLKSNDIVYVEPNKAKVATSSRSQQWVPILLSALSFGIIVVDRVVN